MVGLLLKLIGSSSTLVIKIILGEKSQRVGLLLSPYKNNNN